MFYNNENWKYILYEGKVRTYTAAIAAYWKLFGKASDYGEFDQQTYYEMTSHTAAAQIFCSQEVSDQMLVVDAAISELAASTGTSKERGVYQKLAGDEIEKLINLIRKDIGLKPIRQSVLQLDEKTSNAMLEMWGYKGAVIDEN